MTLANVYYGLIWVLSALVVVAVLRLRGALPTIRQLLRPAIPALLIGAATLGPVALIYRAVDERNGLARGYEPQNSLLPTDLLTPQRDNWLWGTALDGVNSAGKAGEHAYFPGFVALVLGVVGLWVGWRLVRRGADVVRTGIRMDELIALVTAGAVAAVFALGPSPGGVPGPFRVLHRFVPGFDAIRVTSRFAVVSFVAAALLVGLAAQYLIDRAPRRRAVWLAPAIAALVLAEVGGPMARVDVPEGDRLLVYEALTEMDDGVVLELPIHVPSEGVAWAFVEAPRMYHATTDWNVRINGYSGSTPRGFETTAATLQTWPSAEAEELSSELDIRYVILHGGTEQGTPAFTDAELAALIAEVEAIGHTAAQFGEDWLIVRR